MLVETPAGAPLPSIPGYTVQRELGRGGMGVVYLAHQEGLERLVAIKMLPQGAEAERTMQRFQTEAEVIARLQHPNLIQIYEVGTVDGRPFFSMEYVPDGTLEEQLRGKTLAPREAARLIQILATAMHEAHRCGVVHRDLKPGNILLRREGDGTEDATLASGVWLATAAEAPASFCPKITDFGLAKRLGEAEGLTLTHSVLGTPCYMAPEQAGGIRETSPGRPTSTRWVRSFTSCSPAALRSRQQPCGSRCSLSTAPSPRRHGRSSRVCPAISRSSA